MIVDFIKVKCALDKAANMFIRAEIKKRTPFVSQIGVIPQHEGSDASYETVDRQVQEIDYQLTLSKPIELTKEQMGQLSLDDIQRLLTEVAEDMAHKIESAALGCLHASQCSRLLQSLTSCSVFQQAGSNLHWRFYGI